MSTLEMPPVWDKQPLVEKKRGVERAQAGDNPASGSLGTAIDRSPVAPVSGAVPARRKEPRRTAHRILEVSLGLFNRFGEPNVSTTAISSELHISSGNLYYHFPTKDALLDALVDRYYSEVMGVLSATPRVSHVEEAWFLMHTLFEHIWAYRFLYRDLNDLLSKNRRIELCFQKILICKQTAMKNMLQGLVCAGNMSLDPQDVEATATSMAVVLTHWLSFEFERDPRRALEPQVGEAGLLRGVYHVLCLLRPYLTAEQSMHLKTLSQAYLLQP